MYTIALKMLLGDKAKYIMLICALAFSTLLMTQQSSVFCGLMLWTTGTLRNTGASVWVMDPNVEQVNEVKPLRDTDLGRVRSVKGIAWAVPFYFSIQQARLYDGRFKSVLLVGLDSTTLIGAPSKMLQGSLADLWQAHSVIIDEVGVERLSEGRARPLTVGDAFEINDHEVRIVGICEAARTFFGYAYVYTTYSQALEIVPKTRKNLSFILAEPSLGWKPERLARQIEKETGLKALSAQEFFWSTVWWFIINTGIPIAYGTTILLGFIVGIAVSGQTFYSFIIENLSNLGALKAMGASNALLCRMLIIQALFAGFVGYGIGVGLAALFGFGAIRSGKLPFYMPYAVLVFTFCSTLLICVFSALMGIRKISKLDPAEVFRG